MSWKFWEKKSESEKSSQQKAKKLPRPRAIPEAVGRYLVVQMTKDPNWVWSLRSVIRKREGESPSSYHFRLYEDGKVAGKGVIVKDFNSFDAHPDLVLFQGWFDKKSMEVHMEKKKEPPVLPKAA